MDGEGQIRNLRGSPSPEAGAGSPDADPLDQLIDDGGERPKRSPLVQVSRQRDARGETVYVLNNPQTRTYLELDDRNYFLWSLMTGEETMWDVTMDYYAEYRCFPADRLAPLLDALKANHLLEATPGEEPAGPVPPPTPASRLRRWARATFQRTFPIPDADGFYDALYRRGGRLLFAWPALLVSLAVSAAGFACFLLLESSGAFSLSHPLSFQGTWLLSLLLFTVAMVFLHESAHALACKRFGRKVLGAGFMFYYGMPAFYVDVTDTWMASKRARIAVALAGPASTAVLAGALSVAAALLPPSHATLALYQMAFIANLAVLFNLNPLLELDGYYVLEDLLGINRLREKAFAFLRGPLWGKLRPGGGFGRRDALLFVFGALSLAYSVFAVWLALYLWRNHLRQVAQGFRAGHDWLAVVLLGGLTFAAGTALIVGLGARLLLLLSAIGKRLRRPGPEGAQAGP